MCTLINRTKCKKPYLICSPKIRNILNQIHLVEYNSIRHCATRYLMSSVPKFHGDHLFWQWFRSHPQSSVGRRNQTTFTAQLDRELTHLFLYIGPLCNIIDDMLHPFPEIYKFTMYFTTITGPPLN